MPGIRQSMKTMSYGSVASCSCTAAIASFPDPTASTRLATALSGSWRISRAAALSSTTRTRSRLSLSGTILPVPVAEPTPSQAVK